MISSSDIVMNDAILSELNVANSVINFDVDGETNIGQDQDDDDSSCLGNNGNRDAQAPTETETENLVKSEQRAIRCLRGTVIMLLAAATILTGLVSYRLARKNQVDSFTRDFEALANRMINQFENGIGSYLFQSYTLSKAISGGMFVGSEPSFPDVTLKDLDTLAYSLRLQARAMDVVWSPLLKSWDERTRWEKYAETTAKDNLTSVSTGQNKACYVCGEGNEVARPNEKITAPSIGTFTCQTVQQGAISGLLTADYCLATTEFIRGVCGCQKANITASPQASVQTWQVSNGMFRLDKNGTAIPDHGPAPFSPVWQFSPAAAGKSTIMFNQMSDPRRRKAITDMVQLNMPVFSESFEPTTNAFAKLSPSLASTNGIVGVLFYPVYETSQSNQIAGSLATDFSWKFTLEVGLTEESNGMVVVLQNSCNQAYTFHVVGNQVDFAGEGDLHDEAFDSLVIQSTADDFLKILESISLVGKPPNVSSNLGCVYNIQVYPSTIMRAKYLTSKPWGEAFVVVAIFVFTSMVFLLYDLILRRLQAKVIKSAKRSEAIVSSLFPAVVRDRLYGEGKDGRSSSLDTMESASFQRKELQQGPGLLKHKIRMKSFLAQPSSEAITRETEPIADLFPNTTILFADIAGFTAWSSEREPAQVFKLLETIYGAFDKIANKLGVFKIETIGDCYVAVSGLPDPRDDHAVVMAKFAFECILKMGELSKKLESSLGPGTADLAIRVGLHSGPVTGGVLRGERARFQLFGDTMNTASRMESNGKVNHIHVSNETAQLLITAGKSDWVEQRGELTAVKGKGELQTYWVKPTKSRHRKVSMSSSDEARSSSGNNGDSLWGATSLDTTLSVTSSSSRRDRLIAWNADLLEQFLQKIVARHKATTKTHPLRRIQASKFVARHQSEAKGPVVDEISEIIRMPTFSEQTAKDEMDPALVDVGAKVRTQLRDYVAHIAALYHDNAFHNFEHASHVVMSASKLLKRIITPDDVDYRADDSGKTMKSHAVLSKEIHLTTYGISSDPLMQFAVVFSALVHDVDHTGLQNVQLVKRNDPLALAYSGKCVAEQNSVQCAWHMLMEDRFADLRRCILQTEEDRLRFRQLVVNAVIATDIADKELRAWRQKRWDKAFHDHAEGSAMDRRATLLFEYIIQASDVAPTMQHWHIYQKWNQRLFEERYIAFLLGNDETDPSQSWYQGELDFFDNYVIPLARNLEESHVFGVSCDEYLAYALENRREWALKGKDIVQEMIKTHQSLISQLGSEHPLHDGMLL